MKNIVVRPGDTLSKLILLEYGVDNTIDSQLLECLIRYISYINGYRVDFYDNINSGDYIRDPDSLQPGKVLQFPNTLEEALSAREMSFVSSGVCKQYYKPIEETENVPVTIEKKKLNLLPVYIGAGLLLLLLFRKKKNKRK